MNVNEIPEAFTDISSLEVGMDIVIPSIPVAGLVTALAVSTIDLRYDHARDQGIRRLVSAVVSHAIYATTILGAVL